MDTRNTLLTQAERMMRQRGYDAVSFGDLANQVGIRTASIHYHFPKKADLAAALLDTYTAKLARQRDNIAANAANGGAAITALIALYRVALDEGRQLCLCVAFSSGRDSLDEGTLTRLDQFHADSLLWLEESFARARADGSLSGITNPKEEATACLAQLEGAQVLARAAGDVARFDDAMRLLAKRIT